MSNIQLGMTKCTVYYDIISGSIFIFTMKSHSNYIDVLAKSTNAYITTLDIAVKRKT